MTASIGNRYSLTTAKVNLLLLTLGLATASSQAISASPTDSEESHQTSKNFTSMSLKELLQVKYTVDTASKKRQFISEAPAIISVLTDEDIKRRGVNNLYEAIATLPGANLVESYIGYTMLNFRGGQQESYNNSVLLLINGHPSSEGDFGSFHLELIPLNIVERIEVIRGPGSALYGTNALDGVINIITKTPIKASAEVEIGAGSNDYIEGAAWWGNDKFRLAISGTKDNGYNYSGTLDEASSGGRLPVNFKNHNKVANLFFDYEGEAVRINAAYFQQDKFMFGITPEINRTGVHDFDGGYLDIKYTIQVGEGDLVSRLHYDYMNRRTLVGRDPPGIPDAFYLLKESDIYGIELEYYREIQGVDVIGGLTYQSVSSVGNRRKFITPNGLVSDISWSGTSGVEDYSAYFQAIANPLQGVELIFGGRFNKADTGNTTFVPRFGLSYFYNPNLAFKLLYGEAYRTPDIIERYAGAGVSGTVPITGTPDLDAEQIKTLDLGVDYTLNRRYTLRANLFYQQRTDSIKRVPLISYPNVSEFLNVEGDDSYGLELELDGRINPQLSIFANVSVIDGEDKSTDREINGLMNLSANAGLSYQLSDRFNTSLNLQYIGEQENRLNSNENTAVNDYWLANLVGEYRIHRLRLRATVKNLGDTEYTYPEYIRANIKDIPGGAGRSFYLNASYEF